MKAAVRSWRATIRRSAGMRQFRRRGMARAAGAKENLGSKKLKATEALIPEPSDALADGQPHRCSTTALQKVVLEAVVKQFQSGEGAIQFAPEAIARSNADLLPTAEAAQASSSTSTSTRARGGSRPLAQPPSPRDQRRGAGAPAWDVMGSNPCGRNPWELISLQRPWPEIPPQNRIVSRTHQAQADAFKAGWAWRGLPAQPRFRGGAVPPGAPGIANCGA